MNIQQRQRNYRRNGDVIAHKDNDKKKLTNGVEYDVANPDSSSIDWFMIESGYLYYQTDINVNTSENVDGSITVYTDPYLFINIDSTPEYLVANIPSDIIGETLFRIDDVTGEFIINDNRI